MSRREKREEKQSNKTFGKLIKTALFLGFVFCILKFAPNYIRNDITDRTNLIINNSNVTADLKKPVLMEDGITYIAKEDIYNFFDRYIYYDNKYNQIITGSETKIASIVIGESKMNNNGSEVEISGTVKEKDGTYYIPFSELDDVYNVQVNYIKDTNTVTIDSLNRKYTVADSKKNNSVKYLPTAISRSVDKIEKGESVVVVTDSQKGDWVKVRTKQGKLGYVKEADLANKVSLREDMEIEKQIKGKVSMIWDYVYEYNPITVRTEPIKGVNVVSPTFFTLTRLGKGEVHENVGEAYIKWAHDNGYKVWPSISNSSMIDTTSEIMKDYKLRQKLIEKIVSLVVKYDLDGINIDFEYMYDADKDLFSRFIIELTPRLKEIGRVVSVDVTAPDGGENWSMCYDRHVIGKVADYVAFMAYDQNGISSSKPGTTAGHDWVKVNLDKFVGIQEDVDSEKIILGIPFYTRVWEEVNGKATSTPVNIKALNDIIPSSANKVWDDDLKQYVTEYTKNGVKYKVWIEDEKSIEAKLDLIDEYKLAGAAYWTKDGEMASIWDLISEKLGI